MDDAMLRPDCARCAALCCVAFAFDAGPMFAFDKPAGRPCVHLSAHDRCRIHARRAEHGMTGCAAYDCLGAGQAATAMFAGRSWRDDPESARAIFAAFAALRRIHELLALLRAAGALDLPPAQEGERRALESRLAPAQGWSAEALRRIDLVAAAQSVRAFLAGLKDAARHRYPPDFAT